MAAAIDIDPNVELLADLPIAGLDEDLFDRVRLAHRISELAMAGPVTAPRMVALTGDGGAGKSSVLRMVTAIVGTKAGLALISIDAASHASTQAVMATLNAELTKLFEALGVVEAKDKVRNTLTSYGGMVGNLAKLAGVNVNVAGALERSAESMRNEIAQNLEQAGKQLVIVIDHLDRLPPSELSGALIALRMYAAIPYASTVIAADRRMIATRHARAPGTDPATFERMVQVELALPAPDRLLLARVMAGGLERIAARTHRDLDAAFALFDPEGGLALDLIETPRDAKRAINALAAAVPLLPTDVDVHAGCLEIVLRVLVPELDGTRLEARRRHPDRDALFAELSTRLAGHRRVTAAREALRSLILGDSHEPG